MANNWKRVVLAAIAMTELYHGADAVLRRRDHSGYLRGGMRSSYHQSYFRNWPSWYNYHQIDESSNEEPIPQPSAPPTKRPTSSPVQDVFYDGEGSPGVCPQGQALVQVEVRTDNSSCETKWTLEILPDGSDNLEIVDSEDGYLQNTHYVKTNCVDGGIYVFTIFDSFGDGIDEPGFYKVMVDGDEVAYGTRFYSSETTWILVSAGPVDEEEMAWTTSSSTTHVLSGGDFDYISDEDLQELQETLPTGGTT
ncbi:hypothetical protein THAOC_13036 [Thalassiosira oceanica]|uniref:GOLD domain-containing protein n=1 Tax=Thalassiosira oceanica TaxID=159749 RepID=K0T6J8_THAOC|nr:hypothetical protein THAOC_13036 [Thalassiosira oceanica]|eukprot:EJK66062.1 hypothetical protein THAOC_13036 [Thalassiosira oceanica]